MKSKSPRHGKGRKRRSAPRPAVDASLPLSAARILTFLEQQARQPLAAGDILSHFRIPPKRHKSALRLLERLVDEGQLLHLKGDRYCLPRQVHLLVGRVRVHRDGYGFVVPDEKGGSDVFIPARFLRDVMDGDRVAVRIEARGRDGKPEGRVVRIVERAHATVVGRFEAAGRFGYVVPTDPRLQQDVLISAVESGSPRSGQIVVVRIDAYPARNRSPEGAIVEVLGDADDPAVEILAVAHKYQLPDVFPAEVLAAAEALPQAVVEADRAGREDLHAIPLVTIDGETAKDFDDAVAVRDEGGGRMRLWVAIADVGHYVVEGGVIDREALERSTSVYFPGQCIPMLPERLSNGICSLNPEVERLAMVAELLFDDSGQRIDGRYYPALMRSRARLTYTEVSRLLVDDELPAGGDPELGAQLRTMEVLARRLMAMRKGRGGLDFDLPEAEIVLDLRGRPENIVKSERTIAHRIIEEFMLAANEAVAGFLTAKGAPFLYRVHEAPTVEKLQAFQEFVAHFNYGLEVSDQGVAPRQLQALLEEVAGHPEERMFNQVLLRSMQQAIYAPENVGHYGLAADPYCHFTSPIRRYPDLIVHRVLRAVLDGRLSEARKAHCQQILPELGRVTSARERRAMEAEREIVDLRKCQFMAEHLDEEFDGFVSGVMPFGFFVELQTFFVEGLVHVSSLQDDFYFYEEDLHRLMGQNRRRSFQIGNPVRVRVAKVNLERREIDFLLCEGAATDQGKSPLTMKRSARRKKPAKSA